MFLSVWQVLLPLRTCKHSLHREFKKLPICLPLCIQGLAEQRAAEWEGNTPQPNNVKYLFRSHEHLSPLQEEHRVIWIYIPKVEFGQFRLEVILVVLRSLFITKKIITQLTRTEVEVYLARNLLADAATTGAAKLSWISSFLPDWGRGKGGTPLPSFSCFCTLKCRVNFICVIRIPACLLWWWKHICELYVCKYIYLWWLKYIYPYR